MPRYYCLYCDSHLTHDSASHNSGFKHKANVRGYYREYLRLAAVERGLPEDAFCQSMLPPGPAPQQQRPPMQHAAVAGATGRPPPAAAPAAPPLSAAPAADVGGWGAKPR
eukprot:PRCOL_00005459-RA